jgi:hypothetical protein
MSRSAHFLLIFDKLNDEPKNNKLNNICIINIKHLNIDNNTNEDNEFYYHKYIFKMDFNI